MTIESTEMQRNLQLLSVFKKILFEDHVTLVPSAAHALETIRSYSGEPVAVKPFTEVLRDRREQAQRSLLVQVQSDQSCGDLYDYCRDFGNISSMYYYQTPKNLHYVLVEMADSSSVKEVLKKSSHLSLQQAVPVLSPFLWFKVAPKKKSGKKEKKLVDLVQRSSIETESKSSLIEAMSKELSLSNQMTTLFERTKINELGTKLRFLTAQQIEIGIGGLFREIHACPFGSSVNGFGKSGCDLDLVLVFPESESTDSRLVFHAKACSADDRLQVQNHIEVLGDMMHCFMPGCVSVKKIIHARVPIIKYRQELTHLECDISLYHTSCLQMSEVLYLLGSFDQRVREVVFTVRAWAKEIGLTNSSPGRWISNFSLTLLVLFFLQQSSVKILPPLKRLRHRNFIMTSEEFNSYASELASQLTPNSISGQEILLKFFQFYSKFDFSSYGINLLTGKSVVKPDYAAMFIVNPVEPELNVSKNVSVEETERLRAEMRNAAWQLETNGLENPLTGDTWGLTKLLEPGVHSQANAQNFPRGRSRLVDVKSLFDG